MSEKISLDSSDSIIEFFNTLELSIINKLCYT